MCICNSFREKESLMTHLVCPFHFQPRHFQTLWAFGATKQSSHILHCRSKELWKCRPGDVGTLPDNTGGLWLGYRRWACCIGYSEGHSWPGPWNIQVYSCHLICWMLLKLYRLMYLFPSFQILQMVLWLLWKQKLRVATQPGSRPWRAGSRLHLENKL